jgi:hypothetical protein
MGEQFAVMNFFADGRPHYVCRFVSAQEACRAFEHCLHSAEARFGIQTRMWCASPPSRRSSSPPTASHSIGFTRGGWPTCTRTSGPKSASSQAERAGSHEGGGVRPAVFGELRARVRARHGVLLGPRPVSCHGEGRGFVLAEFDSTCRGALKASPLRQLAALGGTISTPRKSAPSIIRWSDPSRFMPSRRSLMYARRPALPFGTATPARLD